MLAYNTGRTRPNRENSRSAKNFLALQPSGTLANCQQNVEDGTVLAYAGPDVTDDLAWSVRDTLAKAGVDLPDVMLEDLSPDSRPPDIGLP